MERHFRLLLLRPAMFAIGILIATRMFHGEWIHDGNEMLAFWFALWTGSLFVSYGLLE